MAGYLELPGSSGQSASTPDHNDLDITGNLQAIWVYATDHPTTLSDPQAIFAKGDPLVSTGSYYMRQLPSSRSLRWQWRESGGTARTLDFVAAVPTTAGQHRWYKLEFVVATATGTLYISDDSVDTPVGSVNWGSVFSTQSLSLSTNINSSTDELRLGQRAGIHLLDGRIYAFELRSGVGGTVVANPDFRTDAQYNSATQLTDGTGKVWTVNSSAVWVVEHFRIVTDALGLTDAGYGALELDAPYVLGLTDSISQDFTGGGGEHSQSITDNLGLVDTGTADLYAPADVLGLSDSVVVDYTPGAIERTVTDDLGLLDQGTAALIVQGQSFDLLGLEDSGQADLYAAADLLGLSDSISQELTEAGEERTVTDTVGLTDSGSVDQIADQLGITDVILVALNPIDAAATDALGLVDSGTADSFGDADFLGLVDSVDAELTGAGFTATVDDSLGLTDQITVVISKALETTDALGLVDSGTADRFGNADLLGLTDSVTAEVAGAGEAVVTDSLGLLDTTAQEAATQRSQTDGLGLLDSAAQEISTERSQTDPLGLLDTVSAESQSTRDQTDDLGLTDSITAELIGAGEALFIDPLELTDTGSGFFEGDSDLLGLTDSVFYATGGSESQTVEDNLGLSDTVTGVSDLQRNLSDALGLTDSTETVSAVTRAVTDVLGLTDDVTADLVGAADLVITDPLGLTDDVSVTASFAQTRTDNLGLVDSISVDLVSADEVTNTDPLGLTDNTTQVAASSRSQTDNLGLTDSIDVVLIGQLISVSITDLIGLTDDIDRAGGHQRFADNPLGLVDAVTRAIDYSRERIDLLGLTDSITLQAAGPDFWKPRPVPYTRNPVSHTKAPVSYVPVRAGDSPPWN